MISAAIVSVLDATAARSSKSQRSSQRSSGLLKKLVSFSNATAAWARHPVPMVAVLIASHAGAAAELTRWGITSPGSAGGRLSAGGTASGMVRAAAGARAARPAAAGGEGMTGAISVQVSAVGRPSGGPSACSAVL